MISSTISMFLEKQELHKCNGNVTDDLQKQVFSNCVWTLGNLTSKQIFEKKKQIFEQLGVSLAKTQTCELPLWLFPLAMSTPGLPPSFGENNSSTSVSDCTCQGSSSRSSFKHLLIWSNREIVHDRIRCYLLRVYHVLGTVPRFIPSTSHWSCGLEQLAPLSLISSQGHWQFDGRINELTCENA